MALADLANTQEVVCKDDDFTPATMYVCVADAPCDRFSTTELNSNGERAKLPCINIEKRTTSC